MFPKIPKELLSQLEYANRISKIYQNVFTKENMASIQLAVQQQKQIDVQAIQSLVSAAEQVKIYNNFFVNHKGLNEALNSVISIYETTEKDKFEVTIENIPVCIPKTKLDEYVEAFQSLGIPRFTAIKLSSAVFILFLLFPYTYFVPSLESTLLDLSKWILEVLSFYYKSLLEFLKPEVFANLTLFPLLKIIWDILTKSSNNSKNK